MKKQQELAGTFYKNERKQGFLVLMGLPVAVICVTVITGFFACLTQATDRMKYHNTLLQCYSILEESAAGGPAEILLPEPLIADGYVIGSKQGRIGSYAVRRRYVTQEKTGKILVDRVEFVGS